MILCGTSSKVFKWVYQPKCVVILGRGAKDPPVCNGWPTPDGGDVGVYFLSNPTLDCKPTAAAQNFYL